jgi:hypothetical protein
MSGGKSTTTQSNTVDPQLMALYNSNYSRASNIANQPTQAYTGQLSAPLTGTQVQANGLLSGIATGQTGADTLNQAKTATTGILNGPGVTAGQISDTDLSKYLNPYTQDVIDTSLGDLERSREIQRVADQQSATAAGAFGGSRQGVADSLTNDSYLRNAASTAANLRSQGYNTALGAAQTDISNKLGADEFNANQKANAATSLAGLSNDELTQALQRAGALATAGATEQQTQQTADEAAYQDWLRQLQDPLTKQGVLNQALGIIPMQQTQTSTTTKSGDPLGGILSLGLGIGSLGTNTLLGGLLGGI